MLIDIVSRFKPNNHLKLIHKGIVVTNVDPNNLGRIKVKIEGLLEISNDKVQNLPWAYPFDADLGGGGPDTGSFKVPEINSTVIITFPYEDIYFPLYRGSIQSQKVHQLLFDSQEVDEFEGTGRNLDTRSDHLFGNIYPDINGDVVWSKHDKNLGTIDFHIGKTKFTIRVDDKGDLFLNNKGDVNVEIGGNLNVLVNKNIVVKVLENTYVTVLKDYVEKILQSRMSKVRLDLNWLVEGNQITKVLRSKFLNVVESFSTKVTGSRVSSIGRSDEIVTAEDFKVLSGGISSREAPIISDNGGDVPTENDSLQTDLELEVSEIEAPEQENLETANNLLEARNMYLKNLIVVFQNLSERIKARAGIIKREFIALINKFNRTK